MQEKRKTENRKEKKKRSLSGLIPTHHADRPDRHHAITPVAVGPGVPAWVLSLLQHEHLTSHVLLLITHPAVHRYYTCHHFRKTHVLLKYTSGGKFGDLRSTLNPDGANSVKTLLTQVTALSKQVHPTALEVLIFIEVYLQSEANRINLFLESSIFSLLLSVVLRISSVHLVVAHPHGRVAANAALSTWVRHDQI